VEKPLEDYTRGIYPGKDLKRREQGKNRKGGEA